MALTIGELLEGRDRPLSVRTTDALSHAIELMAKHDFTQLPVTGDQEKLVGIVSSDSILRATDALGVPVAQLAVADAMTRPRSFDPDADVADLLNALRDHYAAIVVDGDEKLVGIITGYDASEYFRRRSEDIMLVEDIESSIKEHIQAACRSADGRVDQQKLANAISLVAQNSKQVRGPVNKAVRLYVSQRALVTRLIRLFSTTRSRRRSNPSRGTLRICPCLNTSTSFCTSRFGQATRTCLA